MTPEQAVLIGGENMAKIYKILVVVEDYIDDDMMIRRSNQMWDAGVIDVGLHNEDDELIKKEGK